MRPFFLKRGRKQNSLVEAPRGLRRALLHQRKKRNSLFVKARKESSSLRGRGEDLNNRRHHGEKKGIHQPLKKTP